MDREAWSAAVLGVTKTQTKLSNWPEQLPEASWCHSPGYSEASFLESSWKWNHKSCGLSYPAYFAQHHASETLDILWILKLLCGSSARSVLCKLVQPLWKTVWTFLKRLKIELWVPENPLLRIYPNKTIIWKDTCTLKFTATLFSLAKIWKQTKCPSTEEWIRRCDIYICVCVCVCIHTQ